jgi:small subunit ribosomal protein S17
MNNQGKNQRVLKGIITSDKMDKTVVVQISRLKKHAKYKKYQKITNKLKAHDPENKYHAGDKVTIKASRPISKDKRWIIVSKAN